MKLLALISGGRSGSSLFLSLLDGHSQIMQFPGDFLIGPVSDVRKIGTVGEYPSPALFFQTF